MRKQYQKVISFILLACLLACSFLGWNQEYVLAEEPSVGGEASSVGGVSTKYSNERIEHNYSSISAQYTYPKYLGDTITYGVEDVWKGPDGTLTVDTQQYSGSDQVLKVENKDQVTFTLNAPEKAIYCICLDYLDYSDSILPLEASLKVNGEYSFYELRCQKFEGLWATPQDKSYDSYGNEVVSIPSKQYEWQNKFLMDSTYRIMEPFQIQLEQGENTLTLQITEGKALLGNLYLGAVPEITETADTTKAEGNEFIEIQAEDFTYRNDSAIHGTCEYNIDLSPYHSQKRVMNTVDSNSFSKGGQQVTYEFEVKNAGYYNLGFWYCQSNKTDFPVFMNIAVDGTIPNQKFKNYPFAYTKDYKMNTLKDDQEQKMSVYLESGVHTISLQISMDPIHESLETIDCIMSQVNDLSLEVTKVVGTNKDKYRDFSLEKYIPEIGDMMRGWADQLNEIADSAKTFHPSVKEIAAFSSVTLASKQLIRLAKEPDELLYRIDELATSNDSVNRKLANLVDSITKNQMSLDRILIYQDGASDQLPKSSGFFKKVGSVILRFFQSFGKQAYSSSQTNPEHLQVSVNRSRQYLEIMQEMIQEEFTKETGIEVDLSLMPDQTKLVLSNASGDSPDIATGINYSIPFELGIRGALKDLTEFEGFKQVASQYNEGLLIPYVIDDSIYAIPETMNFQVLFYRKDVLDKLGLQVPDTLDDVEAMLPDLQMRGLNFYYPTARTVGIKTFLDTTPILFQNGGTLYDTYVDQATLTSENVVEGFTRLTNLFTIYNLPKDVPNFYQHFRNGDYPIGISDFGTYNLISNAAPEIAGSWGVALVPGIADESGNILRYTSAGAESTVMFKSNEEREENAWKFMQWWSSADVQAEFGQRIKISYGDEYYWNTANGEAFEQLPWKSGDKEIILEQLSWTMEAPRVLASYMMERELSDAYNAVALNGENLREALDEAQKNVTRETERKLEEFGYMKDGEVIKQYEVPTIDKVKKILEETE